MFKLTSKAAALAVVGVLCLAGTAFAAHRRLPENMKNSTNSNNWILEELLKEVNRLSDETNTPICNPSMHRRLAKFNCEPSQKVEVWVNEEKQWVKASWQRYDEPSNSHTVYRTGRAYNELTIPDEPKEQSGAPTFWIRAMVQCPNCLCENCEASGFYEDEGTNDLKCNGCGGSITLCKDHQGDKYFKGFVTNPDYDYQYDENADELYAYKLQVGWQVQTKEGHTAYITYRDEDENTVDLRYANTDLKPNATVDEFDVDEIARVVNREGFSSDPVPDTFVVTEYIHMAVVVADEEPAKRQNVGQDGATPQTDDAKYADNISVLSAISIDPEDFTAGWIRQDKAWNCKHGEPIDLRVKGTGHDAVTKQVYQCETCRYEQAQKKVNRFRGYILALVQNSAQDRWSTLKAEKKFSASAIDDFYKTLQQKTEDRGNYKKSAILQSFGNLEKLLLFRLVQEQLEYLR